MYPHCRRACLTHRHLAPRPWPPAHAIAGKLAIISRVVRASALKLSLRVPARATGPPDAPRDRANDITRFPDNLISASDSYRQPSLAISIHCRSQREMRLCADFVTLISHQQLQLAILHSCKHTLYKRRSNVISTTHICTPRLTPTLRQRACSLLMLIS
ncbi:hypothetical protein FKP32DRAFT_1330067 [Trametes sanguinea]|nr:hypothetical protein FKP32DRAFT_1330067 [Trametes sanguinea]